MPELYDLNKVYKELPSRFFLNRHYQQLPLPTEVRLRPGKVPTFRYARVYETEYYLPVVSLTGVAETGDRMLTSTEIHKQYSGKPFYNGTLSVSHRVVLMECFNDYGDDGHIDERLVGWAFVLEKDVTPDLYFEYRHPINLKLQESSYGMS